MAPAPQSCPFMHRLRLLFLLLGDLIILSLTYLLAFVFVQPDFEVLGYNWDTLASLELPFAKIAVLVGTLLFGCYFLGLYDQLRVTSRRKLAEDLMFNFGVCFLLQAFISYLVPQVLMARWVMLAGTPVAFVALIAWRSLYSMLLVHVFGRQRVLFIGDSPLSRSVAQNIIQHPEKGLQVIAFIAEPSSAADPPDFPADLVISAEADLTTQIFNLKPDRIAVAGNLNPNSPLSSPLLWCSMRGMRVESVSELYEILFQRVALETITINQLIFSQALRAPLYMLFFQETYGRILSLLGILLTWPLMLFTAILVRLDSPGPALLRQTRVGLNGKNFEILKFRSMYVDADARFGRTRADNKDPRITRVGSFIRVTRLDELPQFFNVLFGEMNFVGPRPEMPVYVKELTAAIPLYPQRLRVKPGITGWAQLHHIPELTAVETARKLSFDLYYIKYMSPFMDFLIVFHTLRAVIARTGAR
jgi:exopolysaccharide biosynthesis polyprenyl glycosylphosphotransferase